MSARPKAELRRVALFVLGIISFIFFALLAFSQRFQDAIVRHNRSMGLRSFLGLNRQGKHNKGLAWLGMLLGLTIIFLSI